MSSERFSMTWFAAHRRTAAGIRGGTKFLKDERQINRPALQEIQ